MSGNDSDLREAITRAIYAETGAMNFYARMAESIDNPEGKGRFEQLSADERGHRDTLVSWFTRLFDSEFTEDAEEARRSEIGEVSISGQAGAIEALDLAIDAEKKAREFYLAEREKAADPGLKKMFGDLADQEKGHFDLLSAERNALTGGFYWFDMDSTQFLED